VRGAALAAFRTGVSDGTKNRILYSTNMAAGLWAIKLAEA
jgi:hypothetical protein